MRYFGLSNWIFFRGSVLFVEAKRSDCVKSLRNRAYFVVCIGCCYIPVEYFVS